MSLTFKDLVKRFDLKLPKDYTNNDTNTCGYQFSDATVLKMATVIDEIASSAIRQYVEAKLPHAQRRTEEAKERANQKRREAEAKAKDEAAKRAAERAEYEDNIRKRALAANPGLSGEALERVIARLIEDDAVEAVRKAELGKESYKRRVLRTWGDT
jgi:hypothetical protein